jgi:hypothetical protein
MPELTDDERAAIDSWLAKNKPRKYPTGYSAIYDEFGQKRTGLKFRLANLSKRIRRVRGHESMTHEEIAERLKVHQAEIMAACEKHNIRTGQE